MSLPRLEQPYVFISYSSRNRDRVLEIARALADAGIRCWLDEGAIDGGTSYGPEIAAGIEQSAAVVLMCSTAAFDSRNVKQEIQLAWRFGRPYLPLLLEPVTFPQELSYWLEGVQWVEVLDSPTEDWLPRVLRALRRVGVTPDGIPPAEVPAEEAVAPAAAPPPARPLPTNVPCPLSSFLGREAELDAISTLLRTHRLVTLTGAGGSGKTRLAIEAGRDLLGRYADGVWFVELAALTDPALVPHAVAQVLGVRERPDESVSITLCAALRDKQLLLVLDNCEHLIAASAALVDAVVQSCPTVSILATSRQPLHVTGEAVYLVPLLALPPTDAPQTLAEVSRSAAVQLLAERGAAVRPGFVLTQENAGTVAEICRQLDGIPLALELAAARLKLLSVEELAARLGDRFRLLTGGSRVALPRQQTLRATLDWSYTLLESAERRVFQRLSIFAGGWTLAAAEQVCAADDLDAVDVLDLLDALVDHSLVQVEQFATATRYGMLETLRQYALEQLEATDEGDTVRRRHAEWLVELVRRIVPQLYGPRQASGVTQLETEVGNLRTALAWSLAGSDETAQPAVQILAALGSRLWEVTGRFAEGRRWLAAALAHATIGSPQEHFQLLRNASHLAAQQGDGEKGVTLASQALALARAAGDPGWEGASLNNLGNALRAQGDLAGSRAAHEAALAIIRGLDRPIDVAVTLLNLALVAVSTEEWSAARTLLEEAVALHRQAGNAFGIANGSLHLSEVTLHLGDVAAARAALVEALREAAELQSPFFLARAVNQAALLAWATGAFSQAAFLFAACAKPLAEQGFRETEGALEEVYARARDETRLALGAQAYDQQWAAGRQLTLAAATRTAMEFLQLA